MDDILVRIDRSSVNEGSIDLYCRLMDCKDEIEKLRAERRLTINTMNLMGKGLAYENVTKAKTQSAGHELMRIARALAPN